MDRKTKMIIARPCPFDCRISHSYVFDTPKV